MRVKFKRPLGDENDKIVLTIAFLGGFIAIFFIRFLSDNFYPSEKFPLWIFVAIINRDCSPCLHALYRYDEKSKWYFAR